MTKDEFIHELITGAAGMGIQLPDETQELFYLFYSELRRWNDRINLISRRESDWVQTHFLDSLAPVVLDLLGGSERVVDLGSGAGFPGIPLKLACPVLFLALAEASGKKCAWLRHLVRTLGINEAEVLQGRFKDVVKEGWGGSFNLAVSRAAAKPSKVITLVKEFLAPGGTLLVYTTEGLVEKGVGRVYPYKVPGSKVSSVIWEVHRNEM